MMKNHMRKALFFIAGIFGVAGLFVFIYFSGRMANVEATDESVVAARALAPVERVPAVIAGQERIPVEIMRTKEEVTRGLSFRKTLPSGTGMLFLFEAPDIYRFWMKDMQFPIDIIWLDSARRVVHIAARVPPLKTGAAPVFYAPETPAQYVLELNAGESARLGLKKWTLLDFSDVE